MSNEVTLSTFPSTKSQALAMLYLEKQDISGLSPQELVEKYLEIEKEIKDAFSSTRQKAGRFSF